MGIWGGLVVIALANGLAKTRQDTAIDTYVSHIQVHDSAYVNFGGSEYPMSQGRCGLGFHSEGRRCKSRREAHEAGVFYSVVLQQQRRDHQWGRALITSLSSPTFRPLGRLEIFLNARTGKPPIVLGRKLADKLNLKVNSKVQCSFLDSRGEQTSGIFKLVDIYTSSNSLFDELNAFVRLDDLEALSSGRPIHEIALTLNSIDDVSDFKTQLALAFPEQQVDSWREVAP